VAKGKGELLTDMAAVTWSLGIGAGAAGGSGCQREVDFKRPYRVDRPRT